MQPKGFEEAHAAYAASASQAFTGQVRRFGPHGPAYEVLGVSSADDVAIYVIETGERLDYAVSALLADPIAVTVP
jgi:Family of unknown function (DUF5397)